MGSIKKFSKAFFTLILLLIFADLLVGQSTKMYRVVNTKKERYNKIDFKFEPSDSINYIYSNARGSDILTSVVKYDSSTTYEWNGNIFTADEKSIKTYNANNQVISIEYKKWNGSAFEQSRRKMYTYDSSNNLLSTTDQYWSTQSSSWGNYSRVVYTYNPSNFLMVELHQRWSDSTSKWYNFYQYINTYNSNGHKTSHLTQHWDDGTSSWSNSHKYTYTVNSQGDPTSEIWQSWNSYNSEWRLQSRWTYTYNNGWLISEVREFRDGTVWKNSSRKNYTHSQGNYYYTSIVHQKYNTTLGKWENDIKREYSFTSFNKIEEISYEEWDGALWIPYLKVSHYYEEYSPTGIDEHNYNQLKTVVFPNPATKVIHFQFENSGHEPIQLSIFDASGKRINYRTYTEKAKGPVNISWIAASHQIKSGIYFYQLKIGENVSSGQIVVNE